MTAVLSVDESRALAESVRSTCERFAPEQRVRDVAYAHIGGRRGFDAELWQVLCTQIGVAAIALPEEAGGAGYGASALGVVAHELGRVLAPVPFLASTVLANDLLVKAGDHEVASRLATDERTAAAAITGNGGLWDPGAVTLTAEQHGAEWTVDGTARHVLNGTGADDLVIVAISEGRPAIFVVDAAA